MAIEIKLPALGEGVDEAEVLEVLVAEGDEIEPEQGIIEVETEKASAEIPSTKGGRVEKVHVSAGDTVHVGDLLLSLADGDDSEGDSEKESGEDSKDDSKKNSEKQASSKDEASEKEESPRDRAKEHADGEQSENDDAAEESSRSNRDDAPPARKKSDKKEKKRLKKSARKPVAGQAEDESDKAQQTEAKDSSGQALRSSPTDPPLAASPSVRRYAREVDIDLAQVAGTGSGGRITREDVKATVSTQRTIEPPAATSDGKNTRDIGEPESDAFGAVRVERLTKLQQTMARRMLESWTTIPRVTNFDDADVTELEQLRQTSKRDYAEAGVKLTILPLIVKAVALTLKHHPMLNAVLDAQNGEIRFKQYVNVGIAVDTDRGLVVPSLRQADLLSVAEIARRIEGLSQSARDNKLTQEDFYGSTFTISNLGSIGGTYSTPIINPPELAILLLGRARRMRVFVDDDREEPRLILPLSLSYDHRLIDGATAARFLNELKTYIESPSRLLMAP